MPGHVVGWLSLSADERDGITDWLAEVDKQLRPITGWGLVEQYTVTPFRGSVAPRREAGSSLPPVQLC